MVVVPVVPKEICLFIVWFAVIVAVDPVPPATTPPAQLLGVTQLKEAVAEVLIQVPLFCPKSWVCNPKIKTHNKALRPKKDLSWKDQRKEHRGFSTSIFLV